MANFNKSFQDEVRRLARKEVKDDVFRLRKDSAELKRVIAQLRRQIARLDREKKRLSRTVAKVQPELEAADKTPADRARISGKTIRTMRAKTGLTQAEFAELVGVSGQSVYQWERRDGQLKLRTAAKEGVLALKGVGTREAKRRLEEKQSTAKPAARPGRIAKAKSKRRAAK